LQLKHGISHNSSEQYGSGSFTATGTASIGSLWVYEVITVHCSSMLHLFFCITVWQQVGDLHTLVLESAYTACSPDCWRSTLDDPSCSNTAGAQLCGTWLHCEYYVLTLGSATAATAPGRVVLVQQVYGAIGKGVNIMVRRAWVLACLLLFVMWIAIDLGAGAAAWKDHKRLDEVLRNWPEDAIVASFLEPYSISTQSVEFVDNSGTDDKARHICTCTFSSEASQQAPEAPYAMFWSPEGDVAPWKLIQLCIPVGYNGPNQTSAHAAVEGDATDLSAPHVLSKLMISVRNTRVYSPFTSIRMDSHAWQTARFMDVDSKQILLVPVTLTHAMHIVHAAHPITHVLWV
jgi:hypothetical protein